MAFFSQVGLLMWKNFVLQRRKICVSIFEIILPVLFAIIIVAIRLLIEPTPHPNGKTYTKFSLDSNVYGEIVYMPNNSVINNIMNNFETVLKNRSSTVSVTFRGFNTEKELLDYYNYNSRKMHSAFQFDTVSPTDTKLPDKVTYFIRPKVSYSGTDWKTRKTYSAFQTNEPRSSFYPDYKGFGFLALQRSMDEAIIRYWNPAKASSLFDKLSIYLQRMPYPPYISDPMIIVLQNWFPLFIMLGFILCAIQTTKGIVYEKERKLKESMKLMGLSAAAHWSAWFLTVFIYLFVVVLIYSILFGVNVSKYGPVLAESDASLFFVFLLIYAIAIISFCFMVSAFFGKANVGAAVAGIGFFLTYFPYFFVPSRYGDMSRSQKMASCLLLNMGMAMGGYTIGLYEGTGAGAKWSTFYEPATVDDNFSMLDSMIMMLATALIQFLVTWYVDNVRPGEFGVPKPFYFPCMMSYWCGSKRTKIDTCQNSSDETKYFEKEPTGRNAGIHINNLKKVFGKGSKRNIAVNNMNLNMYEGQITVLLGHNGAGKTTTMSMLTGFIPPTSGSALVNGYDIGTDIESVRESLGLCPQHNILFDTMTVDEHLEFFALLKGMPRNQVKAEVDKMVQEIGLPLKRRSPSSTLSGGQKRKLSVGIALIAGSKIVILDEPTSGMDPAARRQAWDILQRNREGRTLVLTTHFMDEADLLGDRIAIMAKGVVKCCGTSYFLKKLYGAGYHLVVVKETHCNVQNVTETIQNIIPTAWLESEINAELSYLLPDDQSSQFANLFTVIERTKEKLGIISFGTTATTMEEVFLKVGESSEETDDVINKPNIMSDATVKFTNNYLEPNGTSNGVAENGRSMTPSASVSFGSTENILAFNEGYTKYSGLLLELSRFRGLFVKKAIHTWRNRLITIVQLLLPVIATILALVVDKARPTDQNEIALTLDLSPFGVTTIPYTQVKSPIIDLAKDYKDFVSAKGQTPESMNLDNANVTNYFHKKAVDIGTASYNRRIIIGGEFNPSVTETSITGHYNGQPFHAAPIALSYIMNALQRYLSGSADREIITVNYPLPKNLSDATNLSAINALVFGFTISFNILFGMAFLTSSFVFFLIKERLVGAKHLQVVSGVGPFVFWLSNLAWDYINYLCPCLLLLPVFAAFQTSAFVEDNRLGIVLLILLFYGWAVIPFMYILQYIFKSPATGFVVIIILNILTGLLTVLTTFVLKLPGLGTQDTATVLEWVFLVMFPHYNLGRSFMDVYVNYASTEYCVKAEYEIKCAVGRAMSCCEGNCGDYCTLFNSNYLAWKEPGIGRFLFFMIFQGLFFLGLTFTIEYQVPQKIWYIIRPKNESADSYNLQTWTNPSAPSPQQEDSDVLAEKNRISHASTEQLTRSESLVVDSLYKRYGNFVAVDHITVGIPRKECFGLLGQNGAGKTTTFKMLTGDVMVTGGTASLLTYDIRTQIQKVQENMGYCPQFDALIDQMTGRETLRMYARLRGVPERMIEDVVNNLINIMMLQDHSEKQTSKYSGGNKRKLSTALALIGDPPFIMLDEPSSGMDPKARRQLWNVLSQVRKSGRTLVLTSHSMEECDALCTRLAIMVNGRFVCLGSPQHLKSKFGQGYTLIARLGVQQDGLTAPTQPLVDFILSNFPSTQVFDDHQGYAHFQVPDSDVPLSKVFSVMEQVKVQFCVEDYSVHQTTLEQVFLTFTRAQIPPKEDKTNLCKRICCCC